MIGVLAFFEPSTRTRVSFEKAGLDLGVRWIHLSDEASSLAKGESLRDHFHVLACYRPDFLVIRHSMTGVPLCAAEWTHIPVINAGDGVNEHPTQGLLDAFTLWQQDSRRRFRVCFFGDVARSRVARSDLWLFKALGYSVSVCDDGFSSTRLFAEAFDLNLIPRNKLRTQDVVIALRVQKERGSHYHADPLSKDELSITSLSMHPGPVILGKDMAFDLCDFKAPTSLVLRQVENGLKVRRQLISELDEVVHLKRKRA